MYILNVTFNLLPGLKYISTRQDKEKAQKKDSWHLKRNPANSIFLAILFSLAGRLDKSTPLMRLRLNQELEMEYQIFLKQYNHYSIRNPCKKKKSKNYNINCRFMLDRNRLEAIYIQNCQNICVMLDLFLLVFQF